MKIVGDQVTEALDAATSQAMDRLGDAVGLPPLVWRASADVDGLSMEGHAPEGCPDPVLSGARWAVALGMHQNSYELRDDVKTWYLDLGRWSVEITSATSFWEMWPEQQAG